MPTKMRLQRFGKKGKAFYHIIIADGRAPRDGRFIEKLGTYDPIARPAEINIDFDRTLYWLQTGASPTDTVKAILAYKGVLYKNHLLKGVKKGALTETKAEEMFQEWLQAKTAKVNSAKKEIELGSKTEAKKRFEEEAKMKQARSEAIAKKNAKEAAAEARMAEEAAVEEAPAAAETPAAEEAAPEAAE
ncbi:MAG: 30S ribosomal protein S16 [Bacteroidetes bacterium]|nr:30S ribosomal protein S16 [Bacteroidota bacterium]